MNRARHVNQLIWFLIALAALWVVGLTVAKIAHGAPPPNADPALAPWFQSLRDHGGISCCSVADCRQTDYRIRNGHYEAVVEGNWLAIPDDKVLTRENPTGRGVVCWLPTRGVMCFVPASES